MFCCHSSRPILCQVFVLVSLSIRENMASFTSLVWDKSKFENASSSSAKKQRCEDFPPPPPPPPSLSEKTDPRSIIKVYNYDLDDEINASSSSAKKQRCEDFPPPPPPSLSEKTDPRSIIKVYNYDSDDEINYEDVDEFGVHEMTDKEYKEYSRQIKESKGFDVMDFPKSFGCGKIMPIINLDHHANHLKSLSELALKEYNEKEKTKLEFVKLVKANLEPCEGFQYYITFDVKDADAVDGPILTFQALVWDGIDEIEVVLCRLEISN